MSDETESLDEDFLNYLAEFEDSDDDWSWFSDEVDDEDAAAKEKAAKAAQRRAANRQKRAEQVEP